MKWRNDVNTKLIAGGALTSLIFAGGFVGLISAQSVADATGLTEEQVIEIALMEVPGEVTEVELESHRDQKVYEVEILELDGTETEVKISAEFGEILRVKAEGEDCNKEDDHEDADDEA
jgi:hypothetical protein